MTDLEKRIVAKIREEGPITFERFMSIALYDPGHGYYRVERTGIGREGDFFTSSHLHPAFGRMIARQMEEMWEFMGKPRDFSIVEMGPGAGYACRDILDYLSSRECFNFLRYSLIELNPSMIERQKILLSEFGGKVSWIPSLREIGEVRGCIFSNELLDAFPVHAVRMGDTLQEIYVSADSENLREEPGPPSTNALSRYFEEMEISLPRGYQTEVNLRIRDWLKEIHGILKEGFVLTIDYGYTAREYYSEDRERGTLICYHKHRFNESPLLNVGEQDITAHVNFSSIRKWGEEIGFRTVGFTSQGAFLISLGIDTEVLRLDQGSVDFHFELAKIKRLFMPQGLGESHMVMAQYKGDGEPELKGFSLRNRLRYL